MVKTVEEARAYRKKFEDLAAYAPAELAVKTPTAYPQWSGEGVAYTDGSGIALPYLPSELVGVYFEEVVS